MKTLKTTSCRLLPVAAALLVGASPELRAQSSSWIVDANEAWSNPANWNNGVLADGVGNTATFDLSLTGSRRVTNDVSRIIGNLVFGNPSTRNGGNWTISGTETLTLDNAGTAPVITAWPLLSGGNSAVNIGCPLSGSLGLLKQGSGTLWLNANNPGLSGPLIIAQGRVFNYAPGGKGIGNMDVVISNGCYLSFWTGGTFTQNFTLNGLGGNVDGQTKSALEASQGNAGSDFTISGTVTLNATSDIGGSYSNQSMTISGRVSGPGGLVKNGMLPSGSYGPGTLTLSNPTNNFTGGVIVSRGTLKISGTNSLGLPSVPSNLVSVLPGGSFNFNGVNLADTYPPASGYTVTIAGFGTDASSGAVYSSASAANNKGLPNLVLATNASIGNNGGKFWVEGAISGPYTLTKVGNSTVVIDGGATIKPEVAGLVVSNGTLVTSTGIGTGGVQVYGPGIFSIYASTRTYTNSLALEDGGTFYKDYQSQTWSGPVTVTGNVTNTVAGTAGTSFTISGPISGPGALTKNGANVLILSGTNTYSGGTVVANGTLVLSGAGSLGDTNAALTLSGGALDLGTSNVVVGAVSITGAWTNGSTLRNGTLLGTSYDASLTTGNAVVTAALLGTSGVTMSGWGGTLTLAGSNTYTGPTVVNAGKLATTTASTGAGAYTVSYSSTLSVAVAAANTTLNVSSLAFQDYSTLEVNLASFGRPAANSPVITVSGDFLPPSYITLQVIGGGAGLTPGQFPLLKYGNVTSPGIGYFTLVLPPGVTGNLVDNVANKSIDLNVTAVAPLVWDGTVDGNWDINGTPNWKTFASYSESGAGGPAVLFDDTATGPNTTITSGSALTVNPLAVTVNNNAKSYSIGGNVTIGGTANVTKSGSGSLALTTNNTYTGGTVVNGGTLQIGSLTSLGLPAAPASLLSVANGASFDFNGLLLDTVYPQASDYTITIAGYGSSPSAGAVYSTGKVGVNNHGLPNLRLAADAAVGNNTANQYWICGKVSGPHALTKVGSGAIVLNGTGSIDSDVTKLVISNGTFTVTPLIGSVPVHVYGPATFSLFTGGVQTYPNSLTLNDGSTFYKANVSDIWSGPVTLNGNVTNNVGGNGGSTLTLSGPISGPGSLTKAGPNALILSGTNTYSGFTSLGAGTISIGDYANLPAGTKLTNSNGGTLQITGTTIANLNPYAIDWSTFNGGLDINHSVNSVTVTNNITGVGSLTKAGAGTLVLSGANSYSGTTTNNGGVLDVGGLSGTTGGSLPNGGLYFTNGAVLQGNGSFTRNFSGSATAGAGQIAGKSGGFAAKGGPLTVNFGGAGASVALASGGYKFGDNFVFGSATADSKVTVINPLELAVNSINRTFTVNAGLGGDAAELAGNLANATGKAGGLTKAGTGLLILGGVCSYDGNTLVNAGTLRVNGSLTASSNSVTVAAVATLGGTGSINGAVTVNGTLAPGGAAIGTLTLNSNLTLNGNMVVRLDKGAVQSNDLVVVAGSLTNAGTGTLLLTNLGPALAAGDKFTLFSKPVAGGDTLTLVGPSGLVLTNLLAIDGSIQVVPSTASNPTNITCRVSGGSLSLSWPADHLGWIAQSNSVNVANPNYWFDIPGSQAGTNLSITVDRATPKVFYRLRHP